uniref:Ig-like domain-containing protein n=1 Tax=Echeneis naucrates TaxID=173247 RepID=A0A665U9P6_ECHNA
MQFFSSKPNLCFFSIAPFVTAYRAILEMVSREPRIFSGEGARLRCSIPDVYGSTWHYQWFRGSEQLAQTGEDLVLWNANVRDGGKFYCKGVRNTEVGRTHTLQSLPVEITVDGGWAILQVPPHPGIVGDALTVTCRLRHNFPLHEVILYRDGVKVKRQTGLNLQFHLTNLTLEDNGMYSCRASWDANRRTYSVISAEIPVQVLETVTEPVLEIVDNPSLESRMTLICNVQYNAPAPAPPIIYYFYKNGKRLGTATSENHDLVRQSPGKYSCKATGIQPTITQQPLTSFKPSPPTPPTPAPPALSINQTAPPATDNSATLSQESDDVSGGSGDMPEESGDTSGNTPETV